MSSPTHCLKHKSPAIWRQWHWSYGLTRAAHAGVAAGGITGNDIGRPDIGADTYESYKLNTGKSSFTEDGEMIMGHKFKYFRKRDKKKAR